MIIELLSFFLLLTETRDQRVDGLSALQFRYFLAVSQHRLHPPDFTLSVIVCSQFLNSLHLLLSDRGNYRCTETHVLKLFYKPSNESVAV